MTATSRRNLLGFLVLGTLLTLFLWKVPFLTQDGANHRQAAVILSRLPDSPVEAAVYEDLALPWRTNSLFPLLYRPLHSHISAVTYEKIFFGFFLLLLFPTYACFLKTWERTPEWWLWALPLCFHPLFWRGMYNFLASVPLTLLALAAWKQGWEKFSWRSYLGFLIFSYLAYLAHPFSLILLGLVGIFLAAESFPEKLAKSLPWLLPLTLVLIAGFLLPLWRLPLAAHTAPFTFASLHEILGGLFAANVSAYHWTNLLAFAPAFGALLLLFYASVRKSPWTSKRFWIACLTAYALFPKSGNAGGYLNERFLIYLWLFLPLGLEWKVPARRWALGLALVATLGLGLTQVVALRRLQPLFTAAGVTLEALPAASRLYPILFDTQNGAYNLFPLLHVWAAYPENKIVFSPYLFAYSGMMPLHRRHASMESYFPAEAETFATDAATGKFCESADPTATQSCAAQRKTAYERSLQHAAFYDYWFVYRPPPEFHTLLELQPGLRLVRAHGDFTLWHYASAKPFKPPLEF